MHYVAGASPLPSFTPPVHFPLCFSHSTEPKLVVRRMLALKAESLGQGVVRASMSEAEGKV